MSRASRTTSAWRWTAALCRKCPPESDIQYDDEGNSFVTVDSPRMYRLIRQTDVTSHDLLLRPADDRFSVYAFTFGAYGLDGN